jgi:hypothetical protein
MIALAGTGSPTLGRGVVRSVGVSVRCGVHIGDRELKGVPGEWRLYVAEV